MSNILKSIKMKMMVFFSSALIISTLAQTLFSLLFANDIYIDKMQDQLQVIYNELVSDYQPTTLSVYHKINLYEDEINLRVFIFDENDRIVYQTLSNQVDPALLEKHSLYRGKIIDNFQEKPTVNIVESYRNNTSTIAIRGSIDTPDFKHYIILETPLATINEAVATLSKFTISFNLITLIVGCIFIFYLASKLSNPISEINHVATSVANLNFSNRARVRKHEDEINELARNINFMSSQLEKMIFDLKIANIQLKKDNDVRKQVDDMRREFIANVSHELKTPLSLLQGYTEMLKNDTAGIDKNFYYDVIIDESRHMNELVNRLLNITSLENGLTKLNYEKFDLSELVQWILSKNEILSKGIHVVSIIKEDTYVFADKLLIEQAITNYLSNALTYAQSIITIELIEQNDKYTIRVSNDGQEISDTDKIWHSFFKEDKARTRSKDKNFGLGLYIVKTIISAHGGEYGVYNIDHGVTFYFTVDKYKDNIDNINVISSQ